VKPKPPPVDNNRKRNRDEDSNVDNSGAKRKLAVDNYGANKLATDSKATSEAHLVKSIESLADDLDAKGTPTKGDIATLIQMLAKQCMEKFREAMEDGAENVVTIDVDNKDNDLHNVDESDVLDVDTNSENGDPEQPIEEDATNK
jgi:predicted lipid-binding transport protein (Tim44 family)